MGLEEPGPGNSVRQTRFSLEFQVNGGWVVAAIPWPVGPRKRGQSSAETHETRRQMKRQALSEADFMGGNICEWNEARDWKAVAPRQRHFPPSISWNLFRISDFEFRIFPSLRPLRLCGEMTPR
jgi:hypothetical protein